MTESELYALVREWSIGGRSDDALAERIAARCDEAWVGGDSGDRGAVLSFVFFRRHLARFRYFMEGLHDGERGVELQAIGYAAVLVDEGHTDFVDRQAMRRFAEKYPEIRWFVESVLNSVDGAE